MPSSTVAQPVLSLLAEAGPADAFGSFVPMLLMFLVFYFIVLRPMNRAEKERRKRVEGLKKGDEVVIGGGIFGKIVTMDETPVAVVEIADRVRVRVLKRDLVDSQEGALRANERGKPGSKKPAEASKSSESAGKSA